MTLASLAALAILVSLGTWQLQRLAWKTALIERVEARMQADPVPLPPVIADAEEWDYRPVTVTGRFRHDREIYLGPRIHKDSRGAATAGVHVLTPLERTDAPGTILVDRGWVPTERQAPESRAAGQVDGVATVTGIARAPRPQAWLQPDNRPVENFWFWLDLPAIESATGVADLAPVVVVAAPSPGGSPLPIPAATMVDFTNNHLTYALTWYGLALTLVAVWIAASIRREG